MSLLCPTSLYTLNKYLPFLYWFFVWADKGVLQNIKEGVQGHAANWYSDVFDLVFPDLDHEEVNKRWKEQLAKSTTKSKGDDADENGD